MDDFNNFANSTLTAGIDDDDLTLSVQAGHGARFPAAPFWLVIWNQTDFANPAEAYHQTPRQAEIVRVTAKDGDDLDILRAQQGSDAIAHNTGGKVYGAIQAWTAEDVAGIGGGPAYTVYVALLTQAGTDDPTAVVLENTLGDTPTLSRVDVGLYNITLTGAFPSGKTWIVISNRMNEVLSFGRRLTDNIVRIVTTQVDLSTPADDILNSTSIEIRVYP